MKKPPLYLVVIGTSAGGYDAIYKMVKHLNPAINVAYCIVVHLSNSEVRSTLANRLQPLTSLTCITATSGTIIKGRHIYIAQPGKHLLIKNNRLLTGHGPEENGHRPSINVLFRSAAVAFNSRTIGVILTGLMSDGTSGMEAIKLCGGTLIVQTPKEAEFPDMPQSTLSNVKVDYSIPLALMGSTIATITKKKELQKKQVPAIILAEARRSEKMAVAIEGMITLGDQSNYGCPECGGVLWEINTKASGDNYRCHTGHVYTENELLLKQAKEAESAMWIAIRLMEERKHLFLKIAGQFKEKNAAQMVKSYKLKAENIKNHVDKMRNLLATIEEKDNTTPPGI